MAQSLFTGETLTQTDLADGSTDYTLGFRFTAAADGTVTAVKWRFPDTTPSAVVQVQAGVHQVSGAVLLDSDSFPLASTPGQVHSVAVSAPITAGVTYSAAIWTPLRYVARASYTWPRTVGDLTAISTNGYLSAAPGTLVMPTTLSGNSAWYGVDIDFEPAPPSSWTYGYGVRVG